MATPALDKILGGDSKEVSPAEGDSSELDAARDVIAAVKRNDATALSLALKRHYEACKSGDEPDEDDYEES